MVKTKTISLLKYNRFEFGDQIVSQFVLFECKWLFSIIFFYFHKSFGSQDRFHTHAFNAWSVKLFGEYDEHILDNELTGDFHIVRREKTLVYFPRDSYHRISNSNGCMTILFSGPWRKKWKEYINGDIVNYGWGRN